MLVRTDDYIEYCSQEIERLEVLHNTFVDRAKRELAEFNALSWYKRWFSLVRPDGQPFFDFRYHIPDLKKEKARAEYQRSSMEVPFIEIPDDSAFFKWCQQDD